MLHEKNILILLYFLMKICSIDMLENSSVFVSPDTNISRSSQRYLGFIMVMHAGPNGYMGRIIFKHALPKYKVSFWSHEDKVIKQN